MGWDRQGGRVEGDCEVGGLERMSVITASRREFAASRRSVGWLVVMALVVSLVPALPVSADPPDVTYSYAFSGDDDDPWESGWSHFSSDPSEDMPTVEDDAGRHDGSSHGVISLRPETISDAVQQLKVIFYDPDEDGQTWGLAMRSDGSGYWSESGYYCMLEYEDNDDDPLLWLVRMSNGEWVPLGDPEEIAVSGDVWLKCEIEGSALRAKTWPVGSTEPGGWTLEASDATYATGRVGILQDADRSVDVFIDDYSLEGYESDPIPPPDPGGGSWYTEEFAGDYEDPWPTGWTHLSSDTGQPMPILDGGSGTLEAEDHQVTSLRPDNYTDSEQILRVIWNPEADRQYGLTVRHDGGADGSQSGYYCTLLIDEDVNDEEPTLAIVRYDDGDFNLLDELEVTVNTNQWMKCVAEGTSIRAKIWDQGSTEPSGWDLEVTDTTYTSGRSGTFLYGDGQYLRIDDYRLGPWPLEGVEPPDLVYSTTSDRSNPQLLDEDVVQGDVHVFADPDDDATQVSYWIDDPTMTGQADRVDDAAPFDLIGGDAQAADPWDTTSLSEGEHTVTILTEFTDQTTVDITATFTVDNQPEVDLLFSTSADRSNPQTLNETTLTGDAYLFAGPDDPRIEEISYWIDDPEMTNPPYRVDDTYPYDLVGGDSQQADPLDTTTLSEGEHTVTMLLDVSSGTDVEIDSSFTVDNGPGPFELLVSDSPDRSSPLVLDGEWVAAGIYVFVGEQAALQSVAFWIDDLEMVGSPVRVDDTAPFDLVDGTLSLAEAWDTTALTEGEHTVTVLLAVESGPDVELDASFVVDNVAEPTVQFEHLDGGDSVFHVEPISVRVTEWQQVESVTLLVNDQAVGDMELIDEPCQISGCTWVGELDTTAMADGQVNLEVEATDGQSILTTGVVGVSVDNTLDSQERIDVDSEKGTLNDDGVGLMSLLAFADAQTLPSRYAAGGSTASVDVLPQTVLMPASLRSAIGDLTFEDGGLGNGCSAGPASASINIPIPGFLRNQFPELPATFQLVYQCVWTDGLTTVVYRPDGASGGVADDDGNPSTIPPLVEHYIDSIEDARGDYLALGFRPQLLPTLVVVEDFSRGLTLPGVIFAPHDEAMDGYLGRHEFAHFIQYGYMELPFLVPWTENNLWWWMEASAEWMTHKAIGDTGATRYAQNIGQVLDNPQTDWVEFGSGREYGSFVIVEYLEELRSASIVPGIWNAFDIGQGEVLGADLSIAAALGITGLNLDEVLADFWVAGHLLTADSNLGPFAFTSEQPSTLASWRSELQGLWPQPAATADLTLTSSFVFDISTPIQPGGARYIDIDLGGVGGLGSNEADVGIFVSAPDAATVRLIRYQDDTRAIACSVEEVPLEEPQGAWFQFDQDCSAGTLVVVNRELMLGFAGRDPQTVDVILARRPHVEAGNPRVVSTGAYALEGSTDSTTATTLWEVDQGASANVVFGDPSDPTGAVTFTANDTYVLSLTASLTVPGVGIVEAVDTVTYLITDNGRPQVNAGSGGTAPLYAGFQADATAVDDGVPVPPGGLALTWEKVSGPGEVDFVRFTPMGPVSTPHQEDPYVTFTEVGEYVLRLTAFDGELTNEPGVSDTITVVVTEHAAPEVSIPGGILRFMTSPGWLGFEGVVSDDGLPDPPAELSLSWASNVGPATVTFDPVDEVTTAAYFPENGVYGVTLTADDSELQGSATVIVMVGVNPIPRCEGGCYQASSWGEPHQVSFDRLKYEFQPVGEFVLAESDDSGVVVQTRQEPWSSDGRVSVNTALAAQVGADRVGFYTDTGEVKVNGEVVELDDGWSIPLDQDGILSRDGDRYYLGWPDTAPGERVVLRVTMYPTHLNLLLQVPPGYTGDMSGLLGDADGDPTNDLALRNGAVLGLPVSTGVVYGSYADSWRIDPSESLFDYAPGESTETFTDLSYPTSVVTLADLPVQDVEDARQVCLAAGVTDPLLLEACILDVAITGDESFAEGSAEAPIPVAAVDGHYFEDFEATVGSEWSETGTETTNGRTYLGRFDSEQVDLSLTGLPPHSDVTVMFDLIVFGDWDGNSGPDRFTVSVDGGPALDTTFSNNTSAQAWPDPYPEGDNPAQETAVEVDTLGAGSSVYRVAVTAQHWSEDLDVEFAGVGLSAGESWAVDNVEVSTTRVLPDVFDLSVGQTVSSGLPASGAGDIEEPRGSDEYAISISEPTSVSFDGQSWFSGFDWSLVDSTGTVVFEAPLYIDQTVELGSGVYRLVVASPDEATGIYTFKTFPVPDPEVFTLTVDQEISWLWDIPGVGAGRITEPDEVDIYQFQIPSGGDVPVVVRFSECSPWFDWELTDQTETVVASGVCESEETTLAPGAYSLAVFSDDHQTGGYSFGVWEIPVVDSYSIEVGDTISLDTPAAGAGNLESPGAKDSYTFDMAAASTVTVIPTWDPGLAGRWTITESGVPVDSGAIGEMVELDAGTYQLTVASNDHGTGTYQLSLSEVPDVEQFTVGMGGGVYPDSPAAGAGRLETPGAEDHYQLTVDLPPGQTGSAAVVFAFQLTGFNCQILDSTGGVAGSCSSPVSLAEGDYTIRVYDTGFDTGEYSFYIWGITETTTQPLTLGTPATESLNDPLDQDHWTFTLASSAELTFEAATCLPGAEFRLLNSNGGTVRTFGCTPEIFTLSAGDYTIRIRSWDLTASGAYEFTLAQAPAPDVFNITVDGTPVDASISPWTNRDQYSFTLSQPGEIGLAIACTGLSVEVILIQQGGGQTYPSVGCNGFTRLAVPAGTHQIQVESRFGQTGSYQIGLWPTPPPESFTIQIGDTIAEDDPAAGAGSLEAPLSADIYQFSGLADSQILLEPDCTTSLRWELTNLGEVVDTHSGCSATLFQLEDIADYELTVDSPSGQTGSYGFTILEVPEPTETTIGLDQEIPAEVAEPMSSHRYLFEVAQPGEVVVSLYDCDDFDQSLEWRLLGPSLETTWGFGCGDHPITVDEPGEYALTVEPDPIYPGPGEYTLKVTTDPVDQFPLDLGEVISDGQPGAGAGNLESRGAVDRYPFTLTQSTEVVMEVTSCLPGFEITLQQRQIYGWWSQSEEWSCQASDPVQLILEPGDYRIEVTHPDGGIGTYSYRLSQTQPTLTTVDDQFNTGTASLSAITEVDVYQFEVDSNQDYILTMTCDPEIRWALHRAGEPRWWDTSCDSPQLRTLTPGLYQLAVAVDQAGTADYQIELAHTPPPDQTTLTLGTPASGNLEEIGSVDQYDIAVSTPTEIIFHAEDCPTGATATLLVNGVYLFGWDACTDHTQYLYPNQYLLEIGANTTGSYTLRADIGT